MSTLLLSVGIYGGMFLITIGLLWMLWDKLSAQVQALGKVFLFLVGLVLIYQFVGWKITMMTGGEKGMVAKATGVSIDNGEAIYWGRGRCTTCHSLGGKGSAIRCPNHGVLAGKFDTAMGERMHERAKEREAATGEKWHGVDYMYECLVDPGGYVVKGYKNEMPKVYQAPISLNLEDIQSVIMYLWAQDGEPDINLVMNPPGPGKKFLEQIKKATEDAATASPFKAYMQGDAERGRKLVFQEETDRAPCIKCHFFKDKGGKVGPELTNVASTRSVEYIIESVLQPSAVIASGFEPLKIETVSGEIITGVNKGISDTEVKLKLSTGEERIVPISEVKGGKNGTRPKVVLRTFDGKVKGFFVKETEDAVQVIKVDDGSEVSIPKNRIEATIRTKSQGKVKGFIKEENDTGIIVVKKDGSEVIIAKDDVKKVRQGYRKPKMISVMPNNLGEILTVRDLHDIVAFLQSLV